MSKPYDPRQNRYDDDTDESYDPYDHLSDDIDRLLEDDAYPGQKPRNYSNGYGGQGRTKQECYTDVPDYDNAEPSQRYVEEERYDEQSGRPIRRQQPSIYAYNADFEKSAGNRSRKKQQSYYEQERRPQQSRNHAQSHAADHSQRRKMSKNRGEKRRHPFLKFLLVLLLLLVVAVAALWFFAKQPISDDTIGTRKSGCSTILLAGTDADGTRTDTMLLLYLDSKNGEMNLLSLPRDTYTQASWSVPKLNSVYGVNDGGKAGMEALLDYVKACVGFRPDGYLLVDMDCFADLVNLMGGVEFDVPMDMQYEDPSQNLSIDLKAGQQKLTGEQSMWLVRFRSGYALADLQRVQVQRDFIQAAMQQWTKPQKLIHYPSAAILLSSNTTTDLSLRNLVWIGKAVLAAKGKGMQMQTLPGEAAMISGGSYYVQWPETTADLVNQYFNPYETAVTKESIYSPWY